MIDFFEFSNEMLCLADQRGYFTRVNSAWTKTLGWTAEALTTRPYIEFVHPDDVAATLREAELLRSEKHETIWFENRYRCIDGTYRLLAWRVSVVHSSNQLVASARDITEQRAADAAIQELAERFRVFMDNSPTIAWAKDEDGRVVFINRTAELKFGHKSRDDWYGKTDYDFWPREVAERFQENDRRVRASGQPEQFFEDTVAPDGRLDRWMTILFPYRDRLSRTFVGGIAIDVSELKRAEEALKQERDLLRNLIELQEREKQHLCHEFHDGLIQYAVGALMSLEGTAGRPDEVRLRAIDAAVENLHKGVDDGRRAIRGIRPAVLDDANLLAALEDLVDQFKTSEIMITIDCDPEIGVLPKSLQTTVYRVAQEALNNARKHSGTDVVRITLKRIDGELHLEVRDFGCGFDLAAARHRGFGLLGMTERVRLQGGELRIESEPNHGTRIKMLLPLPTNER
jgi:PAS domain S-box-containing protein